MLVEQINIYNCDQSRRDGIAERAVRRVKEGTSAVLFRSGLYEKCGLITWNAVDVCQTFKTSWQVGKHLRKGAPENHLKAWLFRLVDCPPISARDQSKLHQCGKKVLPGVLLGYVLIAGRIWKGGILVAGTEELESLDA